MPLDPNIPLSVARPAIAIEDPLETYGKVLTLGGLMQQQQIRKLEMQNEQLKLDQARALVQERQNLANYFNPPSPSAAAPDPERMLWGFPARTPVHPDNVPNVTVAQAPVTPSLPATNVFPTTANLLAPVQTPETPMPAAPIAPPQQPGTTTAVPLTAAAPRSDMDQGPFPHVDYGKIFQIAPQTGMQYAESLFKLRTQYWQDKKAEIESHQAVVDGLASLFRSAHDEKSKNDAVGQAFARQWITPEVRDKMIATPFNKEDWIRDYQEPALKTSDYLKELRDQAAEKFKLEQQAHDRLMWKPQEEEAAAKSFQARKEAAVSVLAPALDRSADEFNTKLAGYPADIQDALRGANTSNELKHRALTSEQYITTQEQTLHNQAVENYQRQGLSNTQANERANQEGKLRDDYNQQSREFQTLTEGYGRLRAAKDAPSSGANDIAFVYGYMKMLDPRMTVRPSQEANAENASGVVENIRNLYNKLITGDRLPEDVRQKMLDTAERLYAQGSADHGKLVQQYSDIARRQNLDPRNVVIDVGTTLTPSGTVPSGVSDFFKDKSAGKAELRNNSTAPSKSGRKSRTAVSSGCRSQWINIRP